MTGTDPRTQPKPDATTSAAARLSVVKSPLEKDLIAKVEPVVESLGFGLRDLEVQGSTIRVTLDNLPGNEPIGIDDCDRAHRALGPMFDVWDPLPNAYTLELSSPGEKPALRLLSHFQEAVGGDIKFETLDAIPLPPPSKPRRRWEGRLESVDAETGEILLKDSLGEHQLLIAQMKDAAWLRDWTMKGSSEKPSKQKPKTPKTEKRK